MKLFYGIVLVLMIFVSACGTQVEKFQPAPVTEPETIAEAEVQPEAEIEAAVVEEEVPEVTSNDVRILKGSMEPMELTITPGSSVAFMNDGGLISVIVIQKDGVNYLNTPLVDAG